MKSSIKVVLACVLFGCGAFLNSCNDAEPDIDDRSGVIECSVTVGNEYQFLSSGYKGDNGFVGEVVNDSFQALHVGVCNVTRNDGQDYRFVVTASVNTIDDPVTEWGISQEELVETLGETSCKVDANDPNVMVWTSASGPVEEIRYIFSSNKLSRLEFYYTPSSDYSLTTLEEYLAERFINNGSLYYNALEPANATVLATVAAEESDASETTYKVVYYSPEAYNNR